MRIQLSTQKPTYKPGDIVVADIEIERPGGEDPARVVSSICHYVSPVVSARPHGEWCGRQYAVRTARGCHNTVFRLPEDLDPGTYAVCWDVSGYYDRGTVLSLQHRFEVVSEGEDSDE